MLVRVLALIGTSLHQLLSIQVARLGPSAEAALIMTLPPPYTARAPASGSRSSLWQKFSGLIRISQVKFVNQLLTVFELAPFCIVPFEIHIDSCPFDLVLQCPAVDS